MRPGWRTRMAAQWRYFWQDAQEILPWIGVFFVLHFLGTFLILLALTAPSRFGS